MVKVLGRETVIGGKSKPYFTKGTPKVYYKYSGYPSVQTLKHYSSRAGQNI
jgi:hypothetical protein